MEWIFAKAHSVSKQKRLIYQSGFIRRHETMPLFQASGSPRPQIAPLARLRTHPPPRTRLPSMRCVVLTALLALTRAEGDEAEGDGAYVSSAVRHFHSRRAWRVLPNAPRAPLLLREPLLALLDCICWVTLKR